MSDFSEARSKAEELGWIKPTRKVDQELLATVRQLPCIACMNPPPNHAHHVTSRGAGGHDTADNVISLCFRCHHEWHQFGPGFMMNKYPSVMWWLILADRSDVIERGNRE